MTDLMIDEADHWVVKGNALLEAAYKMTLQEKRLLLLAISKIDSRKPIPEPIRIYAHEFAQAYNLPGKWAYEAIKEATESLYHCTIKIPEVANSPEDEYRWIWRKSTTKYDGFVELYFTPVVAPYLSELTGDFTRYKLMRVANLTSVHSVRLFEMFMRYEVEGFGYWIVKLDDFRERLGLGKAYERMSNLRTRVLDPVKNELPEKANMVMDYEIIKKGRVPDRLKFTFYSTTDAEALPVIEKS